MANKRNAFEVGTWPCSEEYVKNISMIHSAFEQLVGPKGRQGLDEIFNGVEVEKSNAYGVLNWDSLEAHEKFTEDQESLVRFRKLFESSAKDGVPKGDIIHVLWKPEAALPCLKAPFTELTKIRPKEGISTEAIHGILDEYVALTVQVVGATYGHVVEKPKELVFIVGWKSIEGRKEGVEELNLNEIIRKVDEIAEREVINILLTQFRINK
ncbi:hypothetical protein B0F90DRAFT_1706143 [Multifurca ochricompacta]|uniref:Uncharacterized protein n=1 Tax=Multifurca ochricompacta TaxID=376703 RepID=A0AAD4M7R3_9AGAM|nr:hypothetical protein B0F90DRAFT_1706143 [Multifurca ochricompacta]